MMKRISELMGHYIVQLPRKLPPQETMVSKIAYFLELKLMNFLEWLEINSESVQAFKIAQEESIVNSLDTLWEIYCMLVHIWLCTSFYLLVLIVLDVLICFIHLLTCNHI